MGSAAVAQVRVEPVAGKETANGRRETGGTNSRTGCLSSRRVSGGDGQRRARYRHTESAYARASCQPPPAASLRRVPYLAAPDAYSGPDHDADAEGAATHDAAADPDAVAHLWLPHAPAHAHADHDADAAHAAAAHSDADAPVRVHAVTDDDTIADADDGTAAPAIVTDDADACPDRHHHAGRRAVLDGDAHPDDEPGQWAVLSGNAFGKRLPVLRPARRPACRAFGDDEHPGG
jgi:hypothetical protein